MQIAYDNIRKAVREILTRHGVSAAEVTLLPIEAPRDWGIATNVCFSLAPQLAAEEIAFRTEGLPKKEKKQLTAQITREVSTKLAEELAAELSAAAGSDVLPHIARVESEGAYVNFYYDVPSLTEHVLATLLAAPEDPALVDPAAFGHGALTGKRIMVEYAQPNTHKDFHVGHLRNASIGQAIANLLEFAGNDVLKATYIGDIGLHVAKAMWGDRHRDNKHIAFLFTEANALAGSSDRSTYWGACYKGTQRALDAANYPEDKQFADPRDFGIGVTGGEEDTAVHSPVTVLVDAGVRQLLGLWEENVLSVRAKWQESRDECNAAFTSIFDELLVEFNSNYVFYESTIEATKLGQSTAAELKRIGIAEIDESEDYKGALYVDFEKQVDAARTDGKPVFRDDEKKRIRKLGKMTILRSDGTSLYQTKELGLAKYKFDLVREKFDAELDESLYVVGAEQKLYFEQVLAILRLWGFPNADHCKHISYELVILPEGKMSSREGTIVSYRELRNEAIRRAEEIAREKGIGAKSESGEIDESKVKAIAHDVAIAAIKYAMLKVTGSQQIVFDFEEALSFSGRTAPYLQYAYARAGKLVIEADFGDAAAAGPGLRPGHALHSSETALTRLISGFPSICREAAAKNEPATICTYLYDLATGFNDFYRDCRVLDAPEPERGFRRSLTSAFRRVMRTGFKLLALPLPEEM